jgi:AcrR family transcriptional regulator
MEHQPRTQAERSATTRAALTTAARELWAARGYAEVGTPEIAQAAGVTRGAMYHQFPDKEALFRAVLEAVEADTMQRLGAAVDSSGVTGAAELLRVAVAQWLIIAGEPEVRQIVLLDGPSVLGWRAYRDIAQRYSLGMAEELLKFAVETGDLPPQPVRPLAHILIGSLDEAAMLVATAEDPAETGREVREVLANLLDGLLITKEDG